MAEDLEYADAVETLAMQCLERIPTEGDRVVAEICSAHPELIKAVRAVLHQLESVGLTESSTATEPGRVFGDFRLLEQLGHGGMGVVWLAEQQSLHRKVALKLMHPGFQEDARVRERFRREVQALSMLDHPHICTVYEAGEVEHTPYLAMRYVEGRSLAAELAQRRRQNKEQGTTTGTTPRSTPTRQVLDTIALMEKVARALHAAHEAGVVHRDVKPGNILLDRSDEPILVDFGLAHADDPALSALTVTGEPLGTPAYMAPEQVTGKGGIDRRTDVYALGALLYECVTLRPPFEAPSRDSLYQSVLHDPMRDPRAFNRAIGGELKAVLEKALEKSPRRRFATALEFAEELERIRLHQPIRTRSAGPVLRTARWCQRNRAATAVIVVVSAALLVVASLLQRSVAAETGFQALALLAQADRVGQENPELAFKLCREALQVQSDPDDVDPYVIARTQQAMFQLPNSEVICERGDDRLEWFESSADGEFLVVTGMGAATTVHRGDGELLGELSHIAYLQIPPMAFSPVRGAEFAVGEDEGTVRLYDLSRSLDLPFAVCGRVGVRAPVMRVAWSHDGERLVAAHDDGTASVWTRGGKLLGELRAEDPSLAADAAPWMTAAFLPDGSVIAAGALWSPTLAERRLLIDAEGNVQTDVWAIVTTATRFVTFHMERAGAQLWDTTGEWLWQSVVTARQADFVMDVRFDPVDQQRMAIAYGSGRIELLSADDARLLGEHRYTGSGSVVRLAFSPDGKSLLMPTFGGQVVVVDLASGRQRPLTGHLALVFKAEFTPDGRRVVSSSWDGTVRRWDLERALPGVSELRVGTLPIVAAAGTRIVVATGNGEVLLCDDAGEVLRRGAVGSEWAFLRTNTSGTEAAITCLDGSLWRWDLEGSGDPVRCELPNPQPGFDAWLLADGRIVLRASDPPQELLVVGDGTIQPVMPDLGANVAVAVDAAGERVLMDHGTGLWALLERRGDKFVEVQRGDTQTGQTIGAFAFSADGKRALMSTFGGHVQLWELEPRRRLHSFQRHQQAVLAVAFCPDGRRIASGSFDGTVRIFDPETPEDVLVLGTRDRASVWRIVFLGPDRLVTGSGDGAVRWWWLDAAKLREAVENVDVGPLTDEEKKPFLHLLR